MSEKRKSRQFKHIFIVKIDILPKFHESKMICDKFRGPLLILLFNRTQTRASEGCHRKNGKMNWIWRCYICPIFKEYVSYDEVKSKTFLGACLLGRGMQIYTLSEFKQYKYLHNMLRQKCYTTKALDYEYHNTNIYQCQLDLKYILLKIKFSFFGKLYHNIPLIFSYSMC